MVNELKLTPEQETIYWKLRDTLIMQQKPVLDSIRASKEKVLRPDEITAGC